MNYGRKKSAIKKYMLKFNPSFKITISLYSIMSITTKLIDLPTQHD